MLKLRHYPPGRVRAFSAALQVAPKEKVAACVCSGLCLAELKHLVDPHSGSLRPLLSVFALPLDLFWRPRGPPPALILASTLALLGCH